MVAWGPPHSLPLWPLSPDPLLLPSQCSRTCGGGTQNRRVTCRQLLTDGSFLNLSDELCQGPKASSHKSCARADCPPQITVGDWSKVRAVPHLTAPPLFCPIFASDSPRWSGSMCWGTWPGSGGGEASWHRESSRQIGKGRCWHGWTPRTLHSVLATVRPTDAPVRLQPCQGAGSRRQVCVFSLACPCADGWWVHALPTLSGDSAVADYVSSK